MTNTKCRDYLYCRDTERRGADLQVKLGRALFVIEAIAGFHPGYEYDTATKLAQEYLKGNGLVPKPKKLPLFGGATDA